MCDCGLRIEDDEVFPRLAGEGGRTGQSGTRHSAIPAEFHNDRTDARPQGGLFLRDQPGIKDTTPTTTVYN